jgi:hypothetical protein
MVKKPRNSEKIDRSLSIVKKSPAFAGLFVHFEAIVAI